MGHTFVIAEAGVSHDGDLRKAIDLIDIAKEAGVDAVKFQAFQAEKLAIARGKPELAKTLKRYEMPYGWLPVLKDHCDKVGVEFMATCFYEEALKEVAPLVKRIKVSHAESNNVGFLRHIEECYPHEVIASSLYGLKPVQRTRIRWLHCTPEYPTPWHKVRLATIRADGMDGFSDHTKCQMAGELAVAAGAEIIEVHFRHPTTEPDNPDFKVAHDKYGLAVYIDGIRLAEQAMYGYITSQESPAQTAP